MARTPVAEHEERVRALLAPLRTRDAETVPLHAGLGRVTAVDIVTPIPLPPFRNSQMDGFAVRAAEVAGAPVDLPLVGEIAAAPGEPAPLAPGTAVRIMTGAPLPTGADAVVPVEDTTVSGSLVSIRAPRVSGEYVRDVGSDLAAGDVIVPAGTRLASRHLGALAASGIAEVEVEARVRVDVISTGSELVDLGDALGPGQIFDSNSTALAAAVEAAGAELVSTARVGDQAEFFRLLLDSSVDGGAELILTSGGISQGEYEVVRETLEPLGAHVDVLAMQPGGPQATAVYRGVPVVCFPGNPVSSQLSFLLFVEPVLREIAGLPPRMRAPRILDTPLSSPPGKRQFLRGRALPAGRVATLGGPSSHLVAALAAADVLLDIPEDVTELPAGATVETWEL
ncbi:gephyrin-like molybdotransferase Glp [Pseudolysinimonas yzui]|uniref:Molybdopterin molybdenumtransferase n=1 Tax=Pseudolysinimonas yzui TaxID=2708254 RepID=A0A8J3GQY8_9MICO|nr:gephyrin-like molybdotransferase Glp [Pseudolysinimonas yzui]GHF16298.1 putative molybdopterin biosynthesis protein MoeA [Pseudolysinimonas yzui]